MKNRAFLRLESKPIWLFTALLSTFLFPTLSWSQKKPIPRNPTPAGSKRPLGQSLRKPPRDQERLLVIAEKALAEERFDVAVNSLSKILTAETTGFDPANPDVGQDFFVFSDDDSMATLSIKTRAQQILGEMPPRGRKLYEINWGPEARALLNKAIAADDITLLSAVARKFFHTEAGYEATLLLGRYFLDQGRPLAATFCFQRLATAPTAGPTFEPELSVLLATSWSLAGFEENAASVLRNLQALNAVAQVELGDRSLPLPNNDAQLATWSKQHLGSLQTFVTDPDEEWKLFRGNAGRSANSYGGEMLSSRRWDVETSTDPKDEERIAEIRRSFGADRVGAIPSSHPLVVDDVVVMRTPERLFGVDFSTGRRIWHYPSDPLFANYEVVASQTPEQNHEIRKHQLRQRLWEDSIFGQLSSDGTSVFVIHDLDYSNLTPRREFNRRAIVNQQAGPPQTNKLVSLSLAREGATRWVVGGVTGDNEPELAGVFFLGPPLPIDDHLYVIAEIGDVLRLIVLESDSGKVAWVQQLLHVQEQRISRDHGRRMAGASPSYADGILVCPTSAGAIVAVDIVSRKLLWGVEYPQARRRNSNNWAGLPVDRVNPELGSRWADATITIAAGNVIATPVESNRLLCVDLLTGEKRWDARSRGEKLFVAGVVDDVILTIERESVSGLRLSDGQPAWPEAISLNGEMPSGRGFLTAGSYFLPTTGQRLLKIDVAHGTVEKVIPTDEELGNLICYKGEVISQSPLKLASFYQVGPLRTRIDEALSKDPENLEMLALQAELLLHDEQYSEALHALRAIAQKTPQSATVDALLIKALFAAIRADFAANRSIAEEFEHLIVQSSSRREYLLLMAEGAQREGRSVDAFRLYLRLAQWTTEEAAHQDSMIPGNDTFLEQQRNLQCRQHRWIQGAIGTLLERTTPEERETIGQELQKQLDAIEETNNPVPALRQFVELFGIHPLANQARLELATHLRRAEDTPQPNTPSDIEVELLLSQVERSALVPHLAATACWRLAELFQDHGRFLDAKLQFERLAENWGDVELDTGVTAAEISVAASASDAIASLAKKPKTWLFGQVEVEASKDSQSSQFATYQPQNVIPLLSVRGTFPKSIQLIFDQTSSSILFRDESGEDVRRLSLYDGKSNQTANINASQVHAMVISDLMVLATGFEILAIDLTQNIDGGKNSILWRRSVSSGVGLQAGFRAPVVNRNTSPPLWGGDTRKSPPRNLVAATANGIYFRSQRQLFCVSPLSGDVIWKRDGVTQGANVFGDDKFILIAPKDNASVTLVNAINGEELGARTLEPVANRFGLLGHRVLYWKLTGDHYRVWLQDLATNEEIWSRNVSTTSKGTLVGTDKVAIMDESGQFSLLDILSGEPTITASLKPEKGLSRVTIHIDDQRYFLVTHRTHSIKEGEDLQFRAPRLPGVSLSTGNIYCFDKHSGSEVWPAPARIDRFGLVANQPASLPFLVMLRHESPKRARNSIRTAVLCLDKRTGRVIHLDRKLPFQTTSFRSQVLIDDQMIRMEFGNRTFTVKYTAEAVPPEPPLQMRHLANLAAPSSRSNFDKVTNAFGNLFRSEKKPKGANNQ